MKRKLLMSFLLAAPLFAASAYGMDTELLYTNATLMRALDFKEDLKADEISAVDALSLHGISGERKAAYLTKIKSKNAVIIIGKLAFKAVGEIGFPMPVIAVDAEGEFTSVGAVIHVISADSDVEGAPGSTPVTVSSVAGFSLTARQLRNGSVTTLKCKGVKPIDLVNKLLADIDK